jgi:hypothetical protein
MLEKLIFRVKAKIWRPKENTGEGYESVKEINALSGPLNKEISK